MNPKLLSRRPSPAMVVALVALVSSLTGGAVAATLITGGDIKNGTITKRDLKKNSVNTKKVKNQTLLAKDFAPGQLKEGVQGIQGLQGPKGEPGEKGDQGDPGAAGATNVVYRRLIEEDVESNDMADLEPTCEAGETLIGGGGYFVQTDSDTISMSADLIANGPADGTTASSTPSNWYVAAQNTTASEKRLFAYAICASP